MLSNAQSAALLASKGLPASASNLTRLGEAFGPELAAWAFGQWDLRARAAQKFDRAADMLFVREALEQASHEAVAAHHATFFEPGETVADLTTGIGGDLIALAKRGPACGFELDAERAQYAAHNAGVYGFEPEVIVGDSLAQQDLPPAAFADPARRIQGRRTLDLEAFSPNPFAIANLMRAMPRAAMKLSPMLPDDLLARFDVVVQFVEFGGECREALLVFGQEAGIEAFQIESQEALSPQPPIRQENDPGVLLIEASPAAVRAHCLGQFGLASLGDSHGYLTGDSCAPNPWLTTYQVLWAGKVDQVRRQLQALQSSTPEVKQRGTGLDLIQLQKRWKMIGSLATVVVLYPVGKSIRAVICQKLP